MKLHYMAVCEWAFEGELKFAYALVGKTERTLRKQGQRMVVRVSARVA